MPDLIEATNEKLKSESHRQEFRRQQRLVKSAVDNAKEEWIRRVALESEEAVRDGRTRWRCIRNLQTLHKGRRPVRATSLLKENGELATCW